MKRKGLIFDEKYIFYVDGVRKWRPDANRASPGDGCIR